MADQADSLDLPPPSLRVSRFDSVCSLLTAVMILSAVCVLMLWVVWIIDRPAQFAHLTYPPLKRVSFLATDRVAGTFEQPRAFGQPGEQEIGQLQMPMILGDLAAVSELASRIVRTIDGSGGWNDDSRLLGDGGAGDHREAGPLGDPLGEVPHHERWELHFTANGLEQYVRQLEGYGMELAVVGGSVSGVDYLADWAFFLRDGWTLSGSDPRTRRGDSSAERRLYFLWNRPSPLMRYDRQLLTRAKVELEGREVINFIPQSLEKELAEIELEYARASGHADVAEIAKTVFLSESTNSPRESTFSPAGTKNDRFRFRVVSQRYREPGS